MYSTALMPATEVIAGDGSGSRGLTIAPRKVPILGGGRNPAEHDNPDRVIPTSCG